MEQVKAYREGILVFNAILCYTCCATTVGDDERFRYVEVIYEDGRRHYYYSNQREYEYWEKNFHKNRYTSFHEFWTTEEKRKSDGPVKMDYFVRRPASDYTLVEDLKTVLQELEGCEKLPDRMCSYDNYARDVDYGI